MNLLTSPPTFSGLKVKTQVRWDICAKVVGFNLFKP